MRAAALAVAAALPMPALAQRRAAGNFPSRSITIIVPFPPGGGTDGVSRALADFVAADLGHSVIVENRGGGNGVIGTDYAARQPADGHTLYLGNLGTLAITPHLEAGIRYDPLRSFVPVTQVSASSTILVVHPSLPVHRLQDFVDYARARPGELNYASSSPATMLPMELLKTMAGLDIVHVPYRGSGPAMTDIVAGHVQVMLGGALPTVPVVRAGSLRALAVAGSRRARALPDVPTIAESGFPGYAADSWNGLLAPAGTPEAVIARLHQSILRALQTPEVIRRVEADGAEVVTSQPEEFAAYIAAENAKWKAVVDRLPPSIRLN